MKKKKPEYIDDGRTIANMNVEGMPWYSPKAGAASSDTNESAGEKPEPLDLKQTLAMTKGVLLASLLIAGVFVIIFLLFILFCVFVWFR